MLYSGSYTFSFASNPGLADNGSSANLSTSHSDMLYGGYQYFEGAIGTYTDTEYFAATPSSASLLNDIGLPVSSALQGFSVVSFDVRSDFGQGVTNQMDMSMSFIYESSSTDIYNGDSITNTTGWHHTQSLDTVSGIGTGALYTIYSAGSGSYPIGFWSASKGILGDTDKVRLAFKLYIDHTGAGKPADIYFDNYTINYYYTSESVGGGAGTGLDEILKVNETLANNIYSMNGVESGSILLINDKGFL